MNKINLKINELAKKKGIDPNRLKAIFALERLVARLESSKKLSESLIFKGGFVLVKMLETQRFTRDVDALAFGISSKVAEEIILDVVLKDLNDGILFADSKIKVLETMGDYGGIRVDLCFQFGVTKIEEKNYNKLSRLHLDVGFGSNLSFKNSKAKMPLVIEEDQYNFSWSVYPIEFIFAEKLQTLVVRGHTNTRAKDVYDLWYISNTLKDTNNLQVAIKDVFLERVTEIPSNWKDFFESLDVSIIKNAWKTILFKETNLTFDDAFSGLVKFMNDI